MIKENIYLIDWRFKDRLGVYLIFPAYKAFRGDLGYSWGIGVDLSIGGTSIASLHIGLIIGWLKITLYKERERIS